LKSQIESLLATALATVAAGLDEALLPRPHVERTKDRAHGDFASNLALALARPLRRPPRDIAGALVAALPPAEWIDRVEIAGPGFINFRLTSAARAGVVGEVLRLGDSFGRSRIGEGQRVMVEFVSANPTGPLHVGHGRGAAYGATVADLLEACSFDVHREYYVNDAGRQMDILATSVWLRYLELAGESLEFPSNGYKGDYIWDIAASLHREQGDRWRHPWSTILDGLPADEPAGGDREQHIDGLIIKARGLLGDDGYALFHGRAVDEILADIRDDLAGFGVRYQNWFSERSLTDDGTVDRAIARLREAGHLYQSEGAEWFRSSAFGDEKDRVVVRENGQKTYFASDIAYHMNKFERGFEHLIDVWGADHHGYVPRVRAAIDAMGGESGRLEVLLVQFAILYRGGEKAQMSTRSGEFVTLRELREEVGGDAARFFYVMRKCEQHLDFDLDLARSQSNDNPVYYIQYAHARACAIFRQLAERQLHYDSKEGISSLDQLVDPHEEALFTAISRLPEVVESAALQREPHQLAHYLRDLANDFHTCYNALPFLVDDNALRNARLVLVESVQQVIANGLKLLGVSAPEQM
jgi:arginyl-tRNA synthetase